MPVVSRGAGDCDGAQVLENGGQCDGVLIKREFTRSGAKDGAGGSAGQGRNYPARSDDAGGAQPDRTTMHFPHGWNHTISFSLRNRQEGRTGIHRASGLDVAGGNEIAGLSDTMIAPPGARNGHGRAPVAFAQVRSQSTPCTRPR